MASINLAGAIGLGGKRESVITGLSDIVKSAKEDMSRDISNSLKSISAIEAKKQKDATMFRNSVDIKIPEDKLHPNDLAELTNQYATIMAEVSNLSQNDAIPYMEKEAIKNKKIAEFEANIMKAKQDWETIDPLQKMEKEESWKYDTSQAMDFINKGNYGLKREKTTMDDKAFSADSTEEEVTNTVISAENKKYQNTPYFNIPISERRKAFPILEDEIDKRVYRKDGNINKAIEEFVGSDFKTFMQVQKMPNGTDKVVINNKGIEAEKAILKQSLQEEKGLPKEMTLLYENIIGDKIKEARSMGYTYQEAKQMAKGYAVEKIMQEFDRKKSKELSPSTLDLNPEGASKGLTINNGLGGGSIGKWNYSAPEDVNQSAYVDSVTKSLKGKDSNLTEEAATEIAKKSYDNVGKDLKYVSIQTSATSPNSPKVFEVGMSGGQKGIANGVLMNKSGKVAYIVVEKPPVIDKYGREEEPARDEYVTPTSKMLTDYKTNIGAKEWDEIINKSKETLGVKNNSVSSQKGSEKKVEAPKKVETPKYKTMDNINQSQFNAMKDNEIVIVNGELRIKKDGNLKKYQPKQ